MRRIEQLCCKYTKLEKEEILIILEVEKQLANMAALTNADVFIDCLLDEQTALVVAHEKPVVNLSVYEKSIVGEVALKENEPAVFRAFSMGVPVCDTKAITQEKHTVRQNVVPILNEAGKVIAVLIREKDISEDIQQEKKFEELARTYEVEAPAVRDMNPEKNSAALGIREVHHRVKNNLQLVASILNLQARKCDNSQAQEMLRESVGRVLSIASIHDILTKESSDMHKIEGLYLLEQLRRNLQTLIPVNQDITIQIEGDRVFLSADTATSVALVITELITNAFQHAFTDRSEGTVTVSICSGNLFHTVTVSDNGVGFDVREKRKNSLGLRIVQTTVQDKLKGKLHMISDDHGTRISFDFKKD